MTFLALAALSDTTSRRRWLRVALAGLAVGMGVTEGADLGAIFSVLVAAFVIYQAWITPGPRTRNLATGIGRVSLVAVCAALLAAQAFSELVVNDIQDVSVPLRDRAADALGLGHAMEPAKARNPRLRGAGTVRLPGGYPRWRRLLGRNGPRSSLGPVC